MTDKMKLFVSEYLKDFNATQAAIRSGYSENSAQQIGAENLSKPVIRQAIQKYIDETLDNDKMTLKREIIDELRKIAFNIDPDASEPNKLRALELLGKYMVMFGDKQEVQHTTIDKDGEQTGIKFIE